MTSVRTAEIIAVGTELLTPTRTDTNSLWLTARLNELGIEVRAKAIVGDNRADLAALFSQALGRVDLVVTTGGLGPTEDDVTREVVADVLGLILIEDNAIVDQLRKRFARRRMSMPENNRRQAQVPKGATLLPNPNGSAPGLWIEMEGKVVVLLPGPPRELRPLFDTEVASRLDSQAAGRRVRRRVIKITGRAESQVDEVAQPIYAALRQGTAPIETTILASPGLIELHLSAVGADLAAVDVALDAAVEALRSALGSVVFSVDGRSLEEVVGDALRDRGWRIATAESCTGGLVLGRLTDVPGSSAYVVGGVVAYANEVKVRDLNVSPELLANHGAVSEPVALAMAEGSLSRFDVQIAVAVTGIAGPTGGSDAKPVGTVVIAIAGPTSVARTFLFPGDRQMVRAFATAAALDMVRRVLAEA